MAKKQPIDEAIQAAREAEQNKPLGNGLNVDPATDVVDPFTATAPEAKPLPVVMKTLVVPFCPDVVLDIKQHGYLSARVDCDLTGDMGETLRRVLLACRRANVQFTVGDRVKRVDNGADLVKFLLSQIMASDE